MRQRCAPIPPPATGCRADHAQGSRRSCLLSKANSVDIEHVHLAVLCRTFRFEERLPSFRYRKRYEVRHVFDYEHDQQTKISNGGKMQFSRKNIAALTLASAALPWGRWHPIKKRYIRSAQLR